MLTEWVYAMSTEKSTDRIINKSGIYQVNPDKLAREKESNMILDMDTIQFESRVEIGTIIKALEEWQQSHQADDTVQELIDKLDAMSMSW